MRGKRSNLPWIGTFNFEQPDQKEHFDTTPIPDSAVTGVFSQASSGLETDMEKLGDSGQSSPAKVEDEAEEKDPNLIEFDGPNDPANPQNWKPWKKWIYTTCTFVVESSRLCPRLEASC